MTQRFSWNARRALIGTCGAAALALSVLGPGSAQMMRQQIKNKVIDDVANSMVSEIQSDSCPEFAAMLKKQKDSGSSNAGRASGMMKKDPAARERFVNKVAGPLLNKMIDCDLLPNR